MKTDTFCKVKKKISADKLEREDVIFANLVTELCSLLGWMVGVGCCFVVGMDK